MKKSQESSADSEASNCGNEETVSSRDLEVNQIKDIRYLFIFDIRKGRFRKK